MKRRLLLAVVSLLAPAMLWAQTVNINQASGWLESAYVTWQPVSGADSYNVYYSGAGVTDQKIDDQLIRSYGSYMRADILGLKAGSYTIKVAPVIGGSEGSATSTGTVSVQSHDRSGFAFHNGRVPGAYKADGTPKSGAVILYITENTKNTISLDVTGANSNPCVGLQTILDGYKKGQDNRPLIIRFVGQITDLSYMLNGDIVVENSNNSSGYITLEGVGEDATADGWGIRVKNAANIEIRNLGTMNCNSGEGDNIGLQQNNQHVWVHHVDFFYGDAGGDSDQAKGDGALDTKKSTYVTHSYNHFWDSGKSNLLSNGGETEGYFSYHHNWYDHSDSRHPRVRDHTVHVYNNYFDGISKYGIGATTYSSIFAENNYFRNCKYPMLISEQGSDVYGSNDGTFSSDPGGMIKAYGNYIEGATRFVDQNEFPNDFDAYVTSSRTQQIPSSVTANAGGHAYNNFDTNGTMYSSYFLESASDARNTVMQYAGRMNGGDFSWTFDNSVDDTSYAVNTALKSALSNYSTSLVSIQGDGDGPVIDPNDPDPTDPTEPTDPTDPTTPVDPGDYDHNFTSSGLSSTFYSISGNLSDSKGTVNYGGMTLTQCLKIESSTSVSFTTTSEGTLTLVFNEGWSGNFKIDGGDNAVSSGKLTVTLAAGSHTLTKGDTGNLYFMSLDLGSGGTTQFTVSTSASAGGSVSGGGTFDAGSVISLTATADSGYQFDGWSGDASGSNNPLSVTVDANKSITASFSPVTASTYTLTTSANGNGTVSAGGTYDAGSTVTVTATAASGYYFSGWTGSASGTTNPLSVTMDGNKSITANFSEEVVVIGDAFYVATNGNDSNSGTSVSAPFATLQKAIESVSAGGYIYLRGGTYQMPQSSVVIQKNGAAGAYIHVFAYGDETPILSFDDVELSSSRGIVQDGDFWHWKGVTIEKAGDNGMLLSGNNNIIEGCVFRANHDTGLQLSRYNTSADQISEWPSNNLIVDCEAFDNADSDSEDADGFAAKLTCGTGNIFRRCVSHHNIDDGWDLYTKSETGPIGIILFEDCIAHNNGTLTDGATSGGGDKNGFKLGSSAHQVDHELRRCIAFGNGKHGFTDNGNIGNIKFYNLTSYDNADYNYHTRDNASHTFINCISLDGSSSNDRIVGNAPESCNALVDSDFNFQLVASASDFVTMTPGPDADPTSNGFLNLVSSSPLVDAGCSAPGVSGNGTLDVGAIEYGGVIETQYTITASSSGNGSVTGGGTFTEGSVISLTATANSGYEFVGWSGDASGSNNPLSVTVNGNKSITANFSAISTTQYTVSTSSIGSGSVSGGGTFDEGSTIQLSATAAAGYQFAGWSGDASGSANPLSILVDGNKSISASFSPITGGCVNVTYQMEDGIISNGSVDSNHAGYNGTGFANTANAVGEYVEITVDVPTARTYDVTLKYAATSDRPADVIVNGSSQISNLSLPATVAWDAWTTVDFSLDLASGTNTIRFIATGGSGLPNVDETVICQGGDETVLPSISLSAAESNGSIALNWTVTDGSVYNQQVYRDTDSDPAGRVRIAQSVVGNNYTDNTAVAGTTYYYWIKASADADGSTVSSNAAGASVNIVTYTLTTNIVGQGSVTPNGGQFEAGTSVQLTAMPAAGWVFDSWSGGYTGSTATVLMDADKSVTAVFVEEVVAPGDEVHNYTESGLSSSFFSISGNLSDSKGTVNYNGLTLTQCLKIESSTSISFSTSQDATLTLVFNEGFGGAIQVDGTSYSVNNGVLNLPISAGSHQITKDDVANLYYMSVSYDIGARSLAIENDFEAPQILVYPNPVANQLKITSSSLIERVEVYNLTGTMVNRISSQFDQIDMTRLNSGAYILRVFTLDGVFVHRVIKR
ncbi:InlB B-repeat-containing protein [Reichenbachiella ulvae]|uniref:InlB B-repeat-containing protein n=1 Tax=Reichenbachiella ulvae TaxID=2980104 RepID=A0ABT3CTK7_9BACT|nr:InlB B-repeat-containing protein [Reichenbachiella ulvae]MCV9386954.1 InlB B-repeat-containing protein [Reichenbachiella ulvae]